MLASAMTTDSPLTRGRSFARTRGKVLTLNQVFMRPVFSACGHHGLPHPKPQLSKVLAQALAPFQDVGSSKHKYHIYNVCIYVHMFCRYTSTLQLFFKTTQIPSKRDHEALDRGTLSQPMGVLFARRSHPQICLTLHSTARGGPRSAGD